MILTTESGARVCTGASWVTSAVVGAGWVGWVIWRFATSVPDTSVLLPAATLTEDCQFWYPFICRRMV